MHYADEPCRECGAPQWSCDCGIPEPTPTKRSILIMPPLWWWATLAGVVSVALLLSYWKEQLSNAYTSDERGTGADLRFRDAPDSGYFSSGDIYFSTGDIDMAGNDILPFVDHGAVVQGLRISSDPEPEPGELKWGSRLSLRYENGVFVFCDAMHLECQTIDVPEKAKALWLP